MKHPDSHNVTTSTPWGRADLAFTYARGIVSYVCPGHGGFHISKTLNAVIPEPLRNEDGWYEEDCEKNIPLYFLADLLTSYVDANDREYFRTSIRQWFPYGWEGATGEKVPAEDSYVVAHDEFYALHANDYITITAWSNPHEGVPKGQVHVRARIGGRDGIHNHPSRYFVVPEDEYNQREGFGFVIDLDRHKEINKVNK